MKQILLFIFSSLLYSESCNMEVVSSMEFDQGLSDITGFKQDGREFAVVGLTGDVAAFVDITDPFNPFEVGRITGTSNTWRDLKYWDRHVYIGTEANDGVKVISVQDPDNPILVNTITDFTSSHNIHIDADGYLYVVGAAEHDIWIYNLSNPSEPDSIGAWDGEYLHDIEVYNNKIYGAGIYTGYFYIIDVSNKSVPTTLLSHNTGINSGTHDCAVTDDEKYLITADETLGGHIKIWDIIDYNNINLVSEYMTDPYHSMHNVYVRPEKDLLIMSYYVDGTRILDISDPVNPVEVGYYDTSELTGLYDGNWGTYAYLPSGYIISSDRQNGLFIFSSPLSEEDVEWVACGPIPPLKPSLTAEALLDTIILNWDNVSENSIDGSTELKDFEGYRLYRSIDGGETWGNEEDMIYDSTGDHVGWKPYVQIDYTSDEDIFLYGYDISGADPLAPWIDLGINTGLTHSLIDIDVYPYAEYCYVITAYDTGIPSGYISNDGLLFNEGYVSLESDFHNMVCLSPITPDFYTPPTKNIFIENDNNIGWSQISYVPHSVDTLNTGLYKFEIHAEIDSSTYLLSKTLGPKLFVYEIDESGNQISDYIVQDFPIYSIDDITESWLDILGMYVKIENFHTGFTDSRMLVKLEEAVFSDTTLSERINIKMRWKDQVDFHKQPYFDYQIKFGTTLMDTATLTAPPYSCDDLPDINTLLPFRITNLTFNNQPDLLHADKGIDNGQVIYGEVQGGLCGPPCNFNEICIENQCIESPGNQNCNWEHDELIVLIDSVYMTQKPIGTDNNLMNGCSEIISDTNTVYKCEEKLFELKIGFDNNEYYNHVGADPLAIGTWIEGGTYLSGEIVYHEGMLWNATEDILITNPPDEWFDENGDTVNDNPWKILYPWEDGDVVTLTMKKLLHDGDSWLIDTDLFNQPALANSDLAVGPETFKLESPYPNPFNPVTIIKYSLSYTSNINLTIYDLLGRQVEILYNGIQHANNYTITWDASKYSSGLYFIQMSIQDIKNNDISHVVQTKKIVLLK